MRALANARCHPNRVIPASAGIQFLVELSPFPIRISVYAGMTIWGWDRGTALV
jgi:hypothetical protein